MNYATLWAAAKLSRTDFSKGRLAAGASLGAFYSLGLFLPESFFLTTVWFKAIASVLITAIAFAPLPPKKFLTCLGSFYLASFILGGFIFGMIFFIHSGRISGYNSAGRVLAENFWPGIFLGLAVFWAGAKGFSALVRKGVMDHLFKFPLSIRFNGRQVVVEAFLDTGNRLRDPLTKHPVVVVEYTAIKTLLPEEVQAGYAGGGEPDVWKIMSSLEDKSHATCFSVIPFQSLGRLNGLLLGFRPDEAVIERPGRAIRAGKVILAIYHKNLDPEGSYQALLNPDLLETAP